MKIFIKDTNVKRILFITLSNIGDVILTIPTLESLHLKYPNAIIDIVGDNRSRIIFKYCPYMGNFFEKDKNLGLYGILFLLRRLRQQNYDLAVDLRSDALLYFVKAKNKFFKISNKLGQSLHSVEKHFLSVKKIINVKPPLTNIWLSNHEKELSIKIFKEISKHRALTLGLGANFEGKIWAVSKFICLAECLKDYFDVIILVGDKTDAILSKEFISKYKGKVIDCCGHYNILETAAIIKKSNFYVGNDSGLGHLASAVKIQSFTIFGIGEPLRYKPWGEWALWAQDKDYQINRIDPKVIANRIIQQLN